MLLNLLISSATLQTISALLILFFPCALLLSAWLATRPSCKPDKAWQLTQWIAMLTLSTALFSGLLIGLYGPVSVVLSAWLPTVRVDALSVLMLALTAFLGWVIVRYSHNYLAGDKGQSRYLVWLCLLLAPVWWLVTLNNLLLVCLSWSATSFALHKLLTFYRERPAAIMAAHKKFLISRAADLLTLTATLLVYVNLGTLQIDHITQILSNTYRMDVGIQVAAFLLVLSAMLKCAQLPFHGWLLQVMEAPTPVSALLHAGIVNIGGFILLRLYVLIETTPVAQLFLVIAGSVTATLAALVMMTRISIKVMLAWSTCAQMGFMLLEIGLGVYSLALLHLLAHSLYKAYAFLGAGETVARQRMLTIAPTDRPIRPVLSLLTLASLLFVIALILVLLLASFLTGLDLRHEPAMWLLGGVLASSLLPLVIAPTGARALRQAMLLIIYAFCLGLLYGAWHFVFSQLIPPSSIPPSHIGLGFAGICFSGLLLVQLIVLSRPHGSVSRWLHPRAFAGFHLDEIVTHLTLRIWPVRLMTMTTTHLTSVTVLQPDSKNSENL